MFLYSQWCELPLPVRHEVAKIFNIPKVGPTEVFSNTIKSDGYLLKDIEAAITVASLQSYMRLDETDMSVLWEHFMNRLNGFEVEPEPMAAADSNTEASEPPVTDALENQMADSQAVRQRPVKTKIAGSNPAQPAKKPVKRASKPRAKKVTN